MAILQLENFIDDFPDGFSECFPEKFDLRTTSIETIVSLRELQIKHGSK